MNQQKNIPRINRYISRLTNNSTSNVVVIEVQSGDYLGEDDIVRIDDVYHRI